MSEHNFLNPYPNPIDDASTAEHGVIASELIAEDRAADIETGPKTYGSVTETEVNDPNGGYGLPPGRLRVVVTGLFMAAFLSALDGTIVTTLLTTIASDLHQVGNISWIATSYMLSAAAFQPLFGKLSDIFGRKPLLLICSVLFAIGCALCVTDSLSWLIFGRFVTGIGASGFTALGTMTLSDLIPLRDRGYYQGLVNISFGLGSGCGGLVGGVIADALGWKYVFILQVPMALAVGLVIYLFLVLPAGSAGLGYVGQDTSQKLKRVDFLGSFFLVSALIFLMSAASLGGSTIEFSSPAFVGLVLGFFVFILTFAYVENNVSEEPIIPLELLRVRTVLALSLTNWFYTMGVFTNFFYVPIYFSLVLGLTPTENGKRIIPNFFAISFGSVLSGLYMKRTGRYYKLTVVSGIVCLVGTAHVLLLSPESSLFEQYTISLLPGLGYSSMLTVTLLALIALAPLKFQACTTSIQYTFRSTGSTIGVLIALALFQNLLHSRLTSKINGLVEDPTEAAKIIRKALSNANYAQTAPELVRIAVRDSYAAGCKGAFAFATATIFVGYITSLFMKEHKLHTSIARD